MAKVAVPNPSFRAAIMDTLAQFVGAWDTDRVIWVEDVEYRLTAYDRLPGNHTRDDVSISFNPGITSRAGELGFMVAERSGNDQFEVVLDGTTHTFTAESIGRRGDGTRGHNVRHLPIAADG